MRPIDADELLSLYEGEDENLRVSLRVVKENIKDMPTIEVEPVKHGHWIRTHFASPVWKCSVCKANYNRVSMIGANWCEACGAKMDEVEE